MKIIGKTKAILLANKAESIVEVVIAFVVMTMVMALFAQGIRYSAVAENHAIERSKDSDAALRRLQNTVTGKANQATSSNISDKELTLKISDKKMLKLTMYTVTLPNGGDSNTFYYYVFDADPS